MGALQRSSCRMFFGVRYVALLVVARIEERTLSVS